MLAVPDGQRVVVYGGFAFLREATADESAWYLTREAQPRAYEFLDRGKTPAFATVFLADAFRGGLMFRLEPIERPSGPCPDSQYYRITDLLPD